jgi:EmrB/QacA subfamily drug resistance transporter
MTSTTPTQRNLTVLVACVATAMLMLDVSVVNTAISDMASGLHASLSGLQWVVDAYTLPLAATVLTAGVLADRGGRRRWFLTGLTLFTLASAACGTASNIGTLIASRAVQGLGASIMFATALALIAQVSPTAEERVKALAVYGATIGAAFAIGPFVGGALTSAFGWRAIFLINVPLGITAIVIATRSVAESRDPEGRGVDIPGQVTLIAGLFGVVFGLLRGNDDGWGSAGILVALIGGALLLGAFALFELRGRDPMLPLSLLRDRTFAGAQVAVFAISGGFFAVFLYLTLYLQNVLGLSPIQTGLVYLPGTVLMFVVSGASAQLGTRVRPGVLISVGLVIVGAGMLAMLGTGVHSSWVVLLPGVLLACLGTGLFNPAASAVALSALPPERSGLAAGANDTFRQAALALGIAALGAFVPASSALGGSAQSYVDGLHQALIAAGALSLAGAAATGMLLLGRARSRVPASVPAPHPA